MHWLNLCWTSGKKHIHTYRIGNVQAIHFSLFTQRIHHYHESKMWRRKNWCKRAQEEMLKVTIPLHFVLFWFFFFLYIHFVFMVHFCCSSVMNGAFLQPFASHILFIYVVQAILRFILVQFFFAGFSLKAIFTQGKSNIWVSYYETTIDIQYARLHAPQQTIPIACSRCIWF